MDRVRRLPCAARHLSACEGGPEVDHVGRRPMGRKCSDFETVCFCSLHHRQRTDFSGPFAKFTGVQMREFLDWHLAETKRLLAAHAEEAFPW